MVERASGETLETYMAKNIWRSLGLKDITFWPAKREDMKDRMADMSTRDVEGKTVPLVDFDLVGPSTDCLGGGGIFSTAGDYLAILKAVMLGNRQLLREASYEELFKSQLSEGSKKGLQSLLEADETMRGELGANVPLSGQKSWSLGGLVSLDEHPGWHGNNTLLWQGMPNIRWFIDRENGLCGLVAP